MEPGDSGPGEEVSVGHLCYFIVETKNFTTVTVYSWTQILLKVTSDSEVCRPAHLRDVQKRRVIYSHRYSLFMELTSMLTVFIISEAFLLSFILLFKERKTSVSEFQF